MSKRVVLQLVILVSFVLTFTCTYDNEMKGKIKMLVLQRHNRYRRMAADGTIPKQPRAKHMPQLEWDRELAYKAGLHANSCNDGHDTMVSRETSRFKYVGQNYLTHIPYKSVNPVKEWYDEYQWYEYKSNRCFRRCDSYTQIVAARTKYLGCGVAECEHGKVLTVCNYAPTGNYNFGVPYAYGGSGSMDYDIGDFSGCKSRELCGYTIKTIALLIYILNIL